jgi:O-acetyl-ADP-ribose deacetylase (regulator of RNase III)
MRKPSKFGPQGTFKFIKGDATQPQGSNMRYILQVCNDVGGYGAGFSGALAKRWPKAESEYRNLWRLKFGKIPLGEIQVIQVLSDLAIINMIAQHGIGEDEKGEPPIRYEALKKCLSKAGDEISEYNGTAHMPRIGCGLAGGDWAKVQQIIDDELIKRNINVVVYDLPE